MSSEQLWPEHFDIGITLEDHNGHRTNIGCSPGDAYSPDPYLYVGPWDADALDDPFWNAPFGATLPREQLFAERNPDERAVEFLEQAVTRLGFELP